LARNIAQVEHALEVLLAASPVLEITSCLLDERVDRYPRKRPICPRVQVGEPLEDGKLRACFFRRHSTVSSTGAWSESNRLPKRRRSSGQAAALPASSPRTMIWSMLPASGSLNPARS